MKQEKPLWQPSAKQIKEAQITQFTQQVEHKFQQSFVDYKALHTWSIQHKEDFWASVWDFCQIQSSQSFDAVLLESFDMQKAQWFPGAKLNFAQNLLRFRDDNTAIISIDEQGERQRLSFQQLYVAVSRLTSALLDAGIKPGDCIVGYLPNITETVIAMLATTSIGAIWSACSPDFGVDAAVDRFAQIKPKLLFATDQQQYRGKQHILIEKVKAVCQKVTSIQHVVIIPYQPDKPVKSPPAWISYKNFIHEPSPIPFAQLPFSHPIYILYSSGTTGIPKCLVHSAGGTLIQHLKELILHTDLHRNDTIFYFTTCSWMMWHWLVSSLAVGATMVLYDGAPDYPQTGSLINLIDNTNISVFGTNAKYLSLLEKAHIYPKDTHQLKTLRTILATGSPLLPAQYGVLARQRRKVGKWIFQMAQPHLFIQHAIWFDWLFPARSVPFTQFNINIFVCNSTRAMPRIVTNMLPWPYFNIIRNTCVS